VASLCATPAVSGQRQVQYPSSVQALVGDEKRQRIPGSDEGARGEDPAPKHPARASASHPMPPRAPTRLRAATTRIEAARITHRAGGLAVQVGHRNVTGPISIQKSTSTV
jgi:hypothetical protein